MNWAYALFDLTVFVVPLLATLFWYRDFWRHTTMLMASLAVVALPWILLDIGSHYRGWWEYSPQLTLGPRLFGLPIEEIASFFVVPFACAVLWHILARHIHGWVSSRVAHMLLGGLLTACIALLAVFVQEERTLVAAAVAILTIIALWDAPLTATRLWWVWNGILLLLFVVASVVLTAPPSAPAALGQIGAIPIEDFVYTCSLLNLFLLVWQHALHQRQKRA